MFKKVNLLIVNFMKSLCLLLFTIINIKAIAQPAIYWGDEMVVADGATYGNLRPRISLSADGNPIVLFGKGSQGYLYVAKGNGTNFNVPVSILPSGLNTYLSYWTGPDLATTGDTVIVVFKALPYENGKVYIVRSIDGGLSFSDTIRVDSHDSGMAWMPAIDMSESGKIVLTYMAHDGVSADPSYVYSMSTDAGLNFSPEIIIDSAIPGEACDCCPAEIVIKDDSEVLLYRNNDANVRDIFGVYSSDGGSNFNGADNVDQMNWDLDYCPSTGPDGAITPEGLITVFESKASGFSRVYVSKSNMTSELSFTERIQLNSPTNSAGKQIYPRIANDGDLMVVTWAEAETSNTEIYCALSIDGSLNQFNTTKEQVNISTTGVQTNPDVIVNGNEIHIVYQDNNGAGNVKYRKGILSGLYLNELEQKQIIYPNPSTGKFQFTLKGFELGMNPKFEIQNLKGEIIYKSALSISELEFDLSNQAKGIYFLKIYDENKIYTEKIVIH